MSDIQWLHRLPNDGVYSLRDAQNNLLQVLLTQFRLSRNRDGQGFTLSVSFTENDTAIRRREARDRIQEEMPGYPGRIAELDDRIQDVFFRGAQQYSHLRTDPELAFRYASGGTLPILVTGSTEYYCLFYRDIFPVGWNIANGSCDSLPELLNPKRAIERELREELIILDLRPHPPLDYVFAWRGDSPLAAEVFDDARKLANRFLAGGLDICRDFKRPELPVDWGDPQGPDTLRVEFNGVEAVQQGFYLNINAKDFGIELDRIARIQPAPGFRLLDGEITNNRLLNRPVGLFEVGKTQKALYDGATAFLPDRLFYCLAELDEIPGTPEEFAKDFITGKFLKSLSETGARTPREIEKWHEVPLVERFDLCPVTRSIIRRHIQASSPRIFMSYSHADRAFAERLEKDLTSRGLKVWRDAKELWPSTGRINVAIARALEDSSHVLLLASERSIQSDFVQDEIEYANNCKKPGIALMVEPCRLPLGATRWPRIHCQDRYQEAVDELMPALFHHE